PSGGLGPSYPTRPKSLMACLRPARSRATPNGSEVESPGMSQATQCQNPDPVGASGSKQVTAKERVPSGAPDQLRSGARVCPPRSATSCWAATTEPSGVSAEVRLTEPVALVVCAIH